MSDLHSVFAILLIFAVLIIALHAVSKMNSRDEWYEEGWRDCEKAHRLFEMTNDDKLVLKHLKSAFRAYMDANGYRRKGDVKKLSKIEDFGEFKHFVWDVCEQGKVQKKKRGGC